VIITEHQLKDAELAVSFQLHVFNTFVEASELTWVDYPEGSHALSEINF